MGDRTTWYTDCPHCKGTGTVENYEALSSLIRCEECQSCGYRVPYKVTETDSTIYIEKLEPIAPASQKGTDNEIQTR